jgi:hypothetical protein
MPVTEEAKLADMQLEAGDQDARLPEDKRAVRDEEDVLKVPFKDEEFAVQDGLDYMSLMEWAAATDLPANSVAGLIAIFHMLESIVTPEEFPAFRAHSRANHATAEELLTFVNAGIEAISGRPTEPRDSSQDGSAGTSATSTASSSAKRAKGSRR